jgi:hypothetical protein
MNSYISCEIDRLGGDVADDIWRWFVLNGPHGQEFTWSQTRQQPPGYVGIEHLHRIIEEKSNAVANFTDRSKSIIALALTSIEPEFLVRAVQIAAVIGGESELKKVYELKNHNNELVASHARASLFYMKKRLSLRRAD